MSIVSSYFSSYRPRRSSSSSTSSSSGLIDFNSITDTLSSILAGLALRFIIDRIGGNGNKLTGTLVGLWEGVVLQHFMSKARKRSRSSRSRSSSTSRSSSSRSATPPYDAYVAYLVRLFVDYTLTESVMRVLLIALWTGLGVILADITPSIWRDVGMRRFWRRFRRDMYYMTRSLPSIPLPWSDNRGYSDSVYSSRPIGTRTTTVRFSPSQVPSEVSVITSTTQPPPLIQSFSSRIVPRSTLRPVPGAFPGDTVSEVGTEVTATPSTTSVGLRSPYSDVSTESSRGGLFGSAFNAFALLTGRSRRRSSYPDSDSGMDDGNLSDSASIVTQSVGTSLHNPAEIPDEDESDTETEREMATAKKAKGKGKAKATVEDLGDESTPTAPDIALPTPTESTILQHPSHLPLASTTANPGYLHAGLAIDEVPPPTAEMPVIPNIYGDEEWENISRNDVGSSEEVNMVPPPGQSIIPESAPPDSSFENVSHGDVADQGLEYHDDQQTPLPIKRPELTFTYQVAPVPLPPVDTSFTSPPPMEGPYTDDILEDQPHPQSNTTEFGEMTKPLGSMLGLGQKKKKGGSVLDYDFSGSPWNPTAPQNTQSTSTGPPWNSAIGGSTVFTGAGVVPPPAPAPEFFTSSTKTVDPIQGGDGDMWAGDARGRPPSYHSIRDSIDPLSGPARAATDLGMGKTRTLPPIATNAPPVTGITGTAPGSKRGSRQTSRESSIEKLNTKAQTEIGTIKGSRKGSREQSREPSVDATNRKATTELGLGMKGSRNASKEKLVGGGMETEQPTITKKAGKAGSTLSAAATEPPTKSNIWGGGATTTNISGSALGGWGGNATGANQNRKNSLFELGDVGPGTVANDAGFEAGDMFDDMNAWGPTAGDGMGGTGTTTNDFFDDLEKFNSGAGGTVDTQQAQAESRDVEIPESELDPVPKGGTKLLEASLKLRKKITELAEEAPVTGNKEDERNLKKCRMTADKWYKSAYKNDTEDPPTILDVNTMSASTIGSLLEDAVSKVVLKNGQKLVLDQGKAKAAKWKPLKTSIGNFALKHQIEMVEEAKAIIFKFPTSQS